MSRALVAVYAVLAVATVALFLCFDAGSHSASDTIRPFLISMIPIVLVGLLATRLFRVSGERAAWSE